jgi:hypothetical protein
MLMIIEIIDAFRAESNASARQAARRVEGAGEAQVCPLGASLYGFAFRSQKRKSA